MLMNFNPFPILKGPRICLRQLGDEDIQDLFNYQSNKENFPYVDMPVYKKVDESKTYINKMNKGVEEGKWIIWAISLDDDIIGTISIWNFNHKEETAELGYGLFPAYRKKGYMTESIKIVESYAKKMGIQKLEAYTGQINTASISLLEKNNYQFQKTLTENGFYSDKPIEMVVYEKVI